MKLFLALILAIFAVLSVSAQSFTTCDGGLNIGCSSVSDCPPGTTHCESDGTCCVRRFKRQGLGGPGIYDYDATY